MTPPLSIPTFPSRRSAVSEKIYIQPKKPINLSALGHEATLVKDGGESAISSLTAQSQAVIADLPSFTSNKVIRTSSRHPGK